MAMIRLADVAVLFDDDTLIWAFYQKLKMTYRTCREFRGAYWKWKKRLMRLKMRGNNREIERQRIEDDIIADIDSSRRILSPPPARAGKIISLWEYILIRQPETAERIVHQYA